MRLGLYLDGETVDLPDGVTEEQVHLGEWLLKMPRHLFRNRGVHLRVWDEVKLPFDRLGFYGLVYGVEVDRILVLTRGTRVPWF